MQSETPRSREPVRTSTAGTTTHNMSARKLAKFTDELSGFYQNFFF